MHPQSTRKLINSGFLHQQVLQTKASTHTVTQQISTVWLSQLKVINFVKLPCITHP